DSGQPSAARNPPIPGQVGRLRTGGEHLGQREGCPCPRPGHQVLRRPLRCPSSYPDRRLRCVLCAGSSHAWAGGDVRGPPLRSGSHSAPPTFPNLVRTSGLTPDPRSSPFVPGLHIFLLILPLPPSTPPSPSFLSSPFPC